MNKEEVNKLINQSIQKEQGLPEGLEDRLSRQIDLWDASGLEETKKKESSKRISNSLKNIYLWSTAAACIALLFIELKSYQKVESPKTLFSETYTNAYEAEKVTAKALSCISYNLNKGIKGINYSQNKLKDIRTIYTNPTNNIQLK